jgi:hypothetical protein
MRRVDSVEAENRKTAEELLQAADLCLFVTTGQRGWSRPTLSSQKERDDVLQ